MRRVVLVLAVTAAACWFTRGEAVSAQPSQSIQRPGPHLFPDPKRDVPKGWYVLGTSSDPPGGPGTPQQQLDWVWGQSLRLSQFPLAYDRGDEPDPIRGRGPHGDGRAALRARAAGFPSVPGALFSGEHHGVVLYRHGAAYNEDTNLALDPCRYSVATRLACRTGALRPRSQTRELGFGE